MYGILSDFIYCLNYDILLFSDGIKIPQQSLIEHIFS